MDATATSFSMRGRLAIVFAPGENKLRNKWWEEFRDHAGPNKTSIVVTVP
jgi:hypothetical protein